ncbi:hypothetical protein MLD38_015034 [Melastoma candidum]|uniref:Uncharacterized protein n=1 Tax=Melastoma candidum TaxID=119954 RepID=A0ACB9RG47_9MYRT|nr:hypothetical protein MLD38_015034 [Melastoma candidum]
MEMDSGSSPAEVASKLFAAIRSLVRTLRKNLAFSSESLLLDLQLLLKRTKSLPDLFHRHCSSFTCRPGHPDSLSFVSPSYLREVEFSCSSTPVNRRHHVFSFKKRPSYSSSRVHHLGRDQHGKHSFHVGGRICYGKKYKYDEAATVAAVQRVLVMLNRTGGAGDQDGAGSVMASPMVLPGFGGGRSPAPVRQLRITDSPFPLKEEDPGDGGEINVRADEFIRNFRRDRREEKCMSPYYDYYYYGMWG